MSGNQSFYFDSKKVVLIISLTILTISKSFAILSAATTNVIQGHAPRFNSVIENVILKKDNFKFFGISYQGLDYFTQSDFENALTPLSPFSVKPSDDLPKF